MRNNGMFWERFRTAYPIKATALSLIAAMGFLACGGREAALNHAMGRLSLAYDTLPAQAPRPTKPAEKLHAAVSELQDLLAVQARRDLSGKQAAKARAARERIEAEIGALEKQFAADRKKLKDLGAKPALKRLAGISARMGTLVPKVQTALAQVPADGRRATVQAGAAAKQLSELSPERPHQPLSSDLGFGASSPTPRPASLSAGITPAYGAPSETELASDLPREAQPADLAETPETRVTPAIHQLAQHLQGDPVAIYQYVRNEIRFEAYQGIRKGADQTLAERSGSAADQAALLVALLRDSGIHSRFVQGTVQLPAATAANWLGVDTAAGERVEAAPEILASAGIPTTQVRANGQLVRVRFGHVWAEAYVPGEAYRGAEEQLGGKTWLPLDPSIKANDIAAADEDFRSLLGPFAEQLGGDFVAAATPTGSDPGAAPDPEQLRAVIADARGELGDLLEAERDSELDAADIVGGTTIRRTASPYLPSSLPAQAVSVSAERRGMTWAMNARVTFAVSGSDPFAMPDPEVEGDGGFTYTATTADLAGKRITLAYAPATEDDAEIVDAYHGLLNAPSYAAALIPVLRIDGRVVARGRTAVSTGYTQSFEITYRTPGYAPDTVTNPVYVGSLSAVGLDLGNVPSARLKERAQALGDLAPSITIENLLTDAHGGELLSQLASLYFVRNDAFNSVLSRAVGVHQSRDLSGAITATSLSPRYIGSFPVSVRYEGLSIDVDQDSQVVVAKKGGSVDLEDAYMRMSGMNASSSEAAIFEYTLGWQAASTTRALAAASEAGIPIHSITADNVDAMLERLQLSAGVEEEIAEAVATPGVQAVAPERPVTIGGWRGAGYVISEGTSTAYRITGGANGGAAVTTVAALQSNVATFTERAEESADCDYKEIAVLAIMAVIMALLVLFLITQPLPIPVIAVHIFRFGVAVDSPAFWAAGIPAIFGLGSALGAVTKWQEEC